MDYRIFNVCTWSFLCVCIHTGVQQTDSESAHFWLRKTVTNFSCATDGVWTQVTDFIESRDQRSTNWATPSPQTTHVLCNLLGTLIFHRCFWCCMLCTHYNDTIHFQTTQVPLSLPLELGAHTLKCASVLICCVQWSNTLGMTQYSCTWCSVNSSGIDSPFSHLFFFIITCT